MNEDIRKDDRLQRSINNTDALSKFLDQIDSQADASTHEEASATVVTRERSRKPNAKPRGVNKCKKVANLREGQKLEVEFYNNGPGGDNHLDLTRHMGKLVHDRTICPVRVHSWNDIEESAKKYMCNQF